MVEMKMTGVSGGWRDKSDRQRNDKDETSQMIIGKTCDGCYERKQRKKEKEAEKMKMKYATRGRG